MKNKIKVCVYDSSSNELLLEKDFKEVFNIESLYKWMSKSKSKKIKVMKALKIHL